MPDLLRSGNLVVTPTLTDRLLAIAYLRMELDGTLPVVFFQKVPTIKEFIDEHMIDGARIVLGCFRESEGQEPEFCGMGWVMNAIDMNGYTKAETGMCFFKSSKKSDSVQFGKMMLEMFFSGHNIDCLFGVTPEPNKLALRYSQSLGFDLIGPVPDYCTWHGKPEAGWISHLSKEQWTERQRHLKVVEA